MSTKKDTDRGTAIAEPEAKIKTEPPKLYKVLLHNDDYTPRNFVVMVLVQVFRMGEGEAEGVMWHAHQSGLAVVGLFSFEVAEAKVDTAMKLAAEMDFPMLMTLEPEN